MEINNKEYKVELNRMFIQPHIMINGVVTDIGIWDDDKSDKMKTEEALKRAVDCYEYNKEFGSIVNSIYHIHQSKKEESFKEIKPNKRKWWF